MSAAFLLIIILLGSVLFRITLIVFSFTIKTMIIMSTFMSFSTIRVNDIVFLLTRGRLISTFSFASLFLARRPAGALVDAATAVRGVASFFV